MALSCTKSQQTAAKNDMVVTHERTDTTKDTINRQCQRQGEMGRAQHTVQSTLRQSLMLNMQYWTHRPIMWKPGAKAISTCNVCACQNHQNGISSVGLPETKLCRRFEALLSTARNSRGKLLLQLLGKLRQEDCLSLKV